MTLHTKNEQRYDFVLLGFNTTLHHNFPFQLTLPSFKRKKPRAQCCRSCRISGFRRMDWCGQTKMRIRSPRMHHQSHHILGQKSLVLWRKRTLLPTRKRSRKQQNFQGCRRTHRILLRGKSRKGYTKVNLPKDMILMICSAKVCICSYLLSCELLKKVCLFFSSWSILCQPAATRRQTFGHQQKVDGPEANAPFFCHEGCD